MPFDDLSKEEKFNRLEPTRKLVLDTIRMAAYRVETAMAEHIHPITIADLYGYPKKRILFYLLAP